MEWYAIDSVSPFFFCMIHNDTLPSHWEAVVPCSLLLGGIPLHRHTLWFFYCRWRQTLELFPVWVNYTRSVFEYLSPCRYKLTHLLGTLGQNDRINDRSALNYFKILINCFPQWLFYFTVPPLGWVSSNFPTFYQHLIISTLKFNHLVDPWKGWIVVSFAFSLWLKLSTIPVLWICQFPWWIASNHWPVFRSSTCFLIINLCVLIICVYVCAVLICCILFLRWHLTIMVQAAHGLSILLHQPPTCWGYRHVPPPSSLNIPLIERHMRCSVFKYFLQICGLAFHSLNDVSWETRVSDVEGKPIVLHFRLWLLILYDHLPAPTSLRSPPRQRPLFLFWYS